MQIYRHPVFGDFPHEGFANLQFFRLIFNSPAVDLKNLGLNKGNPIFRQLHNYVVGRPLAYLTEYSIGKGGIIICALNLDKSFIEGYYLLSQICNYETGSKFDPTLELSESSLDILISKTNLP